MPKDYNNYISLLVCMMSDHIIMNALTVQNPHHKCDGETGTITDKKIIAEIILT